MLKKKGEKRSTRDNIKLAGILSCLAGYTNALAFLTVGYYVSHITGIATSFASNIVHLDFKFIQLGLIFLLFILGSMFSSLLMLYYSNSIPIIIEGCILLAVSLIPYKSYNFIIFISINLLPLFLSFAMGMQNASTTYLSSAIVRTTHLTGVATDIGMAIVRKDLRALAILFTILSGFILGAFLGSFANTSLGIYGFLFPGVITLSIGIAYL